MRVRLARDGRLAPRRSWAVARPDEAYPTVELEAVGRNGGVRVATGELVIDIQAEAGRVCVSDPAGRVILADGLTGGPAWQADSGRAWWTKHMPDDERYFGFGERTGLLDKRGRRYTCWTTDEWRHQAPSTDALYVAIPFFLGLSRAGRAYGVFLNNTFRTAFDLTAVQAAELRMAIEGGELDYYVLHGPQPARVLERFTGLVGRMPLPPRWALGYHQARWGYASADEVRHIVAEFRSRRIPLDAIHLDIDHLHGFRVFTWDPDRFPDPASLLADLRADGVRAVSIVDAGVKAEPGYRVYDEGHQRGYFVRRSRAPDAPEFLGHVWPGPCTFPDHARADVRAWWGDQYRADADLGVAGFLNDMNEPAMHDRPYDVPGSDNAEPPLDLPHGSPDEPATHAEVRNVYGLLEDRAAHEGLRRIRPDERPFLLTRAGYAGVQRYAGVWTGDVWSTWEHLEMSLAELLNLGLSGVAFAGADVGGFFGHCGPELLVRWTQLGAFYPFMRNNSAQGTARQEPWVWGERVEAACRRAIEWRYRLLPYLSTVVEEASRTGAPVLRPLLFQYPDDQRTHELADQALLGPDLLLAPVVRPGKTCREVYLPDGAWYDLRSGARHAGSDWLLADAPLEGDLPLFARGGSIIPCAPTVQWTDEQPLDPLILSVFPDEHASAEGELYEDDGHSLAYERGLSCRTRFSYVGPRAGRAGMLSARREGPFAPPPRHVEVHLHGPDRVTSHLLGPDSSSWRTQLP